MEYIVEAHYSSYFYQESDFLSQTMNMLGLLGTV